MTKSMSDKEEVIRKVFYDKEDGFGSVQKTYKAAKELDKSITLKDVREFLAKQEIRQGRKRTRYNSFVPFAPREQFQVDLADFGKGVEPYRYGFVAIDSFSKQLAVVPLKDKTPAETARALDVVVERLGTPNTVYTDDGGEFGGAFQARLKHYLIDHSTTRTSARFVERAIRMLRQGR
jgi:transposase InsO family protein